ncbi:uncharacterized protein TRUGW13939_00608 [Talaromyces rugulosus]|uniref:Uncharacterized protein n=1 Tax=Talaromyces rugulosus TaxID=121627 RepID=A0A7H8QHR1_TALRU|nr:uncharacterized protein TRUGW13939_00608 [Talaromyces rugulosus]QKX53529.1 hypothetical protein TRUGW13939_00608 [Talaromyces rugulosus]
MPDQPRRVLEKSRTVRRRYQRSNKRFQFTASQIQKIEREEEREKKAQQLRDREKKKIANKKKKAEKEAQEREERKRLGLPHPNGPKITASQPLMLNFFGKRKAEDKEDDIEEEEETPTKPCFENVVDIPQQDMKVDKAAQLEDDDTETEFEDDWFDNDLVLEEHSQCTNNAISKGVPVFRALHSDCRATAPEDSKAAISQGEVGHLYMNTNKLCESFEDDTAHLLEDLDPTTILQTLENTAPTLQDYQAPYKASNTHAMPSPPNRTAQRGQAQNCAGAETSERDDYKENWHPNFPRDGRETQLPPPQPAITRRQSSQSQSSHSSGPRQVLDVLSSRGSDDEVAPEVTSPKKDRHASKEPPNDHAGSKDEAPFEIHVDTEDDYGDLDLSTQELKDLDDMTKNNA